MARGFESILAAASDFEVANASPMLTLSRLLIVLGRTGAARAALRDQDVATGSRSNTA
jgi:hypothetical protein